MIITLNDELTCKAARVPSVFRLSHKESYSATFEQITSKATHDTKVPSFLCGHTELVFNNLLAGTHLKKTNKVLLIPAAVGIFGLPTNALVNTKH